MFSGVILAKIDICTLLYDRVREATEKFYFRSLIEEIAANSALGKVADILSVKQEVRFFFTL